MKKIVCLFLILFAVSCKNDRQNNNHTPIKKAEIKDNLFKVNMNIKVDENDKFQLFYIDDSLEGSFSPEKRLAIDVNASDSPQDIQFTLPEKVFPYKFRLDLGENNIETTVEINEIKLQFNNEEILIDKLVLERFFQPNIYLEKTDKGYLRKIVDGRCDPFLISTPLLNKKMELEL
ncbi:MAG: hypothetical protein COW44_12960 [Flavobacteriaceae bacterium CG17_big_fil_post_rev_8_21_14_2_50_33_15]|nr:MAG: hypothetical protein COW44_12960 [Flavobacteriaceae bacterium CG17_big_fil_post_rev_8_21_14_2_50_33_15]